MRRKGWMPTIVACVLAGSVVAVPTAQATTARPAHPRTARPNDDRPAAARTLPLDTNPSGGLAVYTSPDPAPAGSVAYIYSPSVVANPPKIHITGPTTKTVTAVFSHTASPGQWWTAPLPGGTPGVYRVKVTANAKGAGPVTGTSSYEVVGRTGGPRWSSVGPGVMGGILATDPRDQRDMYVASGLSGEIFASRDAGHSWQLKRTLPVAGGYPTALVTVPGRPSRLLLSINGGNGGYVDDPTYTGKILESDDGGGHWRDLRMPDAFVNTMMVTADGSTVAAVTTSGIELGSGTHWRHLDIPWQPGDYSGATLVGGDLYVATFTGLYVVRGVESNPRPPALVFTPPNGRSAWVQTVTGDARTVYADAWSGGVYVSHDAGATWTHAYDPPANVSMFDDVNGTVYESSANSIQVTSDGGAHWTTWPQPVPNIDDQQVAVAGRTVYIGTWDTGLFATTDHGAHYSWLGGVPDINVYAMAVAAGPGGGELVAGTVSDTYRATARQAATGDPSAWGKPAPQAVTGETIPLVATGQDRSVVYKVRSGPRLGTYTIYGSHDAGATWRQLGPGYYGNPGALLVDPADPKDLYVTGSSSLTGTTLNASHDAGATWTSITIPASITALAGDPSNPARLWFGGATGLWTSQDRGKTFGKLQSVPVGALTVPKTGHLVVGGTRLFTSTNGGVTLRPAQDPPLDLSVTALLASPRNPATLYAATGAFHEAGLLKGGHGVLRSTDGGRSWHPFSNNLTDRDILSLAITPNGRTLYAGTQRGGIFAVPVF